MRRLLAIAAIIAAFSFTASAQIRFGGAVITDSSTNSINGGTNVVINDADCNVLTPGANCTITGFSTTSYVSFYQTWNLTGTLTAPRKFIVALQQGAVDCINNGTNMSETFGGVTGTTVTVASGAHQCIRNYDGSNFVADAASLTAITALTGDGTATGPGSAAFTLATVNSGAGACGDATHVCTITTNGKGLTTAQTSTAITFPTVTTSTAATSPITVNGGAGPSTGAVTIACPTCSTGTTTSSLTMNNSNSGAATGATFNGSAPITLSTNTLGAANLTVANVFVGNTQTIKMDGTSGSNQLTIEGQTATNKQLLIGLDSTTSHGTGYIQSVDQSFGQTLLQLNPVGGPVSIDTNACAVVFCVNGSTNISLGTSSQITATGTSTSIVDFSGVPQEKAPVVAGYTTAASGEFGHDSTNHNWHMFSNGVDNYVGLLPSASTYTNGDLAVLSVAGGVVKLVDGGAPSGASLQNNILLNNAGTGFFISRGDSITLPLHGAWPIQLANLLQVPSGNQNITATGSASLPDLFSCNTTPGCTAGGAYPYQIGTLPVSFPLGVANNTSTAMQFSYNDLSNMGSAPTSNQLDYFHGGLLAWGIYYATPDALRLTASANCTTTGTWTSAGGLMPTGSLKTTGAGATLICTGFNAADAGFVAYKNVASTSTFSISVVNAGATVAAYDPYTGSSTFNQTGYYTTAWGGTSNLYAAGQKGLGGGLTTVTYTCVSPDANGCLVAGPYFLSNSMNPQNSPAVLISYTSRDCGNGSCGVGGHTDANTNLIRGEQYKVYKELHDNGINIAIFDPNATPNGYNSNLAAQTGQAQTITVSSGGSGYSTGNITVTGCTITPVFSAVPLSGGVLTTGTYVATSAGTCPTSSGLAVNFTGGGSGASGTVGYVADGTHPNVTGAANTAAVAFNSLNSAAIPSDKDSHDGGVAFVYGGVYAGGAPVLSVGSAAGATPPVGALGSNTGSSSGSPNTGRVYLGNTGWIERKADSGSLHIYDVNSTDQSSIVENVLQTNEFQAADPSANQSSGQFGYVLPGLNFFTFQGWGTGNGQGLSGVVGLYDATTSKFVWNTCSGDDLFGWVPLSGANVCAGTGNTWNILHTGASTFASVTTPSLTVASSSSSTFANFSYTAATSNVVQQTLCASLTAGNFCGMGFGSAATSGNEADLLWFHTGTNTGYASLSTFAATMPIALQGSLVTTTSPLAVNNSGTGAGFTCASGISLCVNPSSNTVAPATISNSGVVAAAAASTVGGSLICTAAAVTGCPVAAVSNAITTATGGTGTGTVTCLTAACTNLRGTYSVAGGTFTTGNFLTLVWPTTTTAYVCTATMNGGTGFLGIGNDVATATGMNISAGVSILGLTVTVNYSCRP